MCASFIGSITVDDFPPSQQYKIRGYVYQRNPCFLKHVAYMKSSVRFKESSLL